MVTMALAESPISPSQRNNIENKNSKIIFLSLKCPNEKVGKVLCKTCSDTNTSTW